MSRANDPKSVSNSQVSVHVFQPNRILEARNEYISNKQFENSNEESSVEEMGLLENLNEDFIVEFEAVKIKDEMESMANCPESHVIGNSENKEAESEESVCSFVSENEWDLEESFISECDLDVSGENDTGSASLWILSKTPIYLHPKERFRCPFNQCSHISIHYTHLKAHIIVAHDDPLKIPCRYCDVIFNEMSDFHKHLKLHGPQLYRCVYCSYYNYIEYVVKGHSIIVHSGVPQKIRKIRNESESTCEQSNLLNLSELSGNIDCDCCNNFHCFSDVSLRKHLIQCLSLKCYTCNFCNKEFSKATNIEMHFQIVHAEKIPYFSVSMKPQVETRLNTLVAEQVAKSRRLLRLPSDSMSRNQRSGVIITSKADTSSSNVTTNCSSFLIVTKSTAVPESGTELITSTSFSNKKRKRARNETPRQYSGQAMCPYCNYISHKSHVIDHLFIHYETMFFACPYCPMENRHKGHVRQHISRMHPKQTVAFYMKPVPANLVVRECFGKSKSPVIIVTQMEATCSNLNEDYLCSKCAFSTSSLNNIRYHCQNEHELASCIVIGNGYSGTIGNNKQKAAALNDQSMFTDADDGKNNNGDSTSEFTCKECGKVLDNMFNWFLHHSAYHSEGSKALKPPTKKRNLNNTAPDWLEDNDKDDENKRLTTKSAVSKSNEKYSLALQCSYCDFVAVFAKNMAAHCNTEHYNRRLAYTKIKNIATYQCSFCLFKTPNVMEGRRHIRDSHCLKFICNKCAKMFITVVAAKLHYAHKHPSEKREISRKSIDKRQYQVLVDAMIASSDDKHRSSQGQLMVNTNFKGCQNATISYTHLCKIFNFSVCVLIEDIKYDNRYLKHFV